MIEERRRQQQQQPKQQSSSLLLSWSANDSDPPTFGINNNSNSNRKKKKNKYASFSKVESQVLDPLEQLLVESELKNQQLEQELAQERAQDKRKRQRRRQSNSNNNEIENDEEMKQVMMQQQVRPVFPDTRTIDPYQPTTFGYMEIGTVLGAHGVHGWIKVQSKTDFPMERLCTTGLRHLKLPNKRAPRPIVLWEGRHRQGDEYLVLLENIEDREQANQIRGATLYVRDEQRDEIEADDEGEEDDDEEDEYFVSDLVGLEVFLVEPEEEEGEESDNDNEAAPESGDKESLQEEEPPDDDQLFVGTVGGVVLAEDLCSIPGLGHDYLEIILQKGVGRTVSLQDELVLIPLVPEIVPVVDVDGGLIYIDPPSGLLDLKYVRENKVRIKGFLAPAQNKPPKEAN